MYIYKVTNKTTGEFYIGYTTDSKKTFSPVDNSDPHSMFEPYTTNGAVRISNTYKEFITQAFSINDLEHMANKHAAQYTGNTLFKGIKHLKKRIEKSQPQPEPEHSKPKKVSNESVKPVTE